MRLHHCCLIAVVRCGAALCRSSAPRSGHSSAAPWNRQRGRSPRGVLGTCACCGSWIFSAAAQQWRLALVDQRAFRIRAVEQGVAIRRIRVEVSAPHRGGHREWTEGHGGRNSKPLLRCRPRVSNGARHMLSHAIGDLRRREGSKPRGCFLSSVVPAVLEFTYEVASRHGAALSLSSPPG